MSTPPYTNITGITRAVMKDNAQETLAGYNGTARPGEIVINLEVDPPTMFVGNNTGQLTQFSTGGGNYSDANVVTLLDAFGSNTITTTGNVSVGQITLSNNARIKDTAGEAVAFGVNAGLISQGNAAVAIGYLAGEDTQGTRAVAIGQFAGDTSQGADAVAIGSQAGETSQGGKAIAIGDEAGENTQGVRAVAIGYLTGQTNQSTSAVAIGDEAGKNTQGIRAVAIGYLAGGANQSNGAIAIGDEAGENTQGVRAVAIGGFAGENTQGVAAVAIGAQAGRTNQAENSIVINATGSDLNNTVADTFVIKPIRAAAGTTILMYNATSGEVTHSSGVQETFQSKTDATGVVDHDCSLGHIFYHTSPDANWTANFTNLDLGTSASTNLVLVIEQGATPYYPSAVQIGGAAQTIKWLGNVTPTPTANKTEIATFTIFNNVGTFTVLGSYSTYG